MWHRSVIQIACRWSVPVNWMCQGQEAPWHTGTHTWQHQQCWNASVAWVSVDTEAGMLSGISRKRSIRSNPCWFTEFCKSQCLSHFAAPFIVVRAETSIAESCKQSIHHVAVAADRAVRARPAKGVREDRRRRSDSASTTEVLVSVSSDNKHWCPSPSPPLSSAARRVRPSASPHLKVQRWEAWINNTECVNDPSAGSPTETLLRLLLPLSAQVYLTSLRPSNSPKHSIGRSDGRCVQRAGT